MDFASRGIGDCGRADMRNNLLIFTVIYECNFLLTIADFTTSLLARPNFCRWSLATSDLLSPRRNARIGRFKR